jgi:hypothetical protein
MIGCLYPKLESNLIPTVTWILRRDLGSRLLSSTASEVYSEVSIQETLYSNSSHGKRHGKRTFLQQELVVPTNVSISRTNNSFD